PVATPHDTTGPSIRATTAATAASARRSSSRNSPTDTGTEPPPPAPASPVRASPSTRAVSDAANSGSDTSRRVAEEDMPTNVHTFASPPATPEPEPLRPVTDTPTTSDQADRSSLMNGHLPTSTQQPVQPPHTSPHCRIRGHTAPTS